MEKVFGFYNKPQAKCGDSIQKGVDSMARRSSKSYEDDDETPKKKLKPASTPEARENQLISLAVDLAEKQLREGTASSQVISHFLKLGSTKEKLELDKLKKENELLVAKTESLQSAKRVEELYAKAMEAFKGYRSSIDR